MSRAVPSDVKPSLEAKVFQILSEFSDLESEVQTPGGLGIPLQTPLSPQPSRPSREQNGRRLAPAAALVHARINLPPDRSLPIREWR
jgi:hypothetical protein